VLVSSALLNGCQPQNTALARLKNPICSGYRLQSLALQCFSGKFDEL